MKTASKTEPSIKNGASGGWIAVVPNDEKVSRKSDMPVDGETAAEQGSRETIHEQSPQGFSLFERTSDEDNASWFPTREYDANVTPEPSHTGPSHTEPSHELETSQQQVFTVVSAEPEYNTLPLMGISTGETNKAQSVSANQGSWISSEPGDTIAEKRAAQGGDDEKVDENDEPEAKPEAGETPKRVEGDAGPPADEPTKDDSDAEDEDKDTENADEEASSPKEKPAEIPSTDMKKTGEAAADEKAGRLPVLTKEETDDTLSGEEPAELKPEVFQHVRETVPGTRGKIDELREGLISGEEKNADSQAPAAEKVVRNPGIGAGGPVDGSQVGDLHATTKIKLLTDEIRNGLNTRNMSGRLAMWQGYARSTLRNTNSIRTNSEIDARCRLNWYVKLFSDVIGSIGESDQFSRDFHHALIGDHTRFAQGLAMIREKLDVPARNDDGVQFVEVETPQCAVDVVVRAICEAQVGMNKAFSTLTSAEQKELADNLYNTFSGSGCVNGHTIPNRSLGRRLTSLMEKMDRTGVHEAAEAFAPLTDRRLLDKLATLPENAYESTTISGQKFQRVATAAGDILIGGRESNTYDLDTPDFKDVVCIIDLGGDNTYRDGVCNLHRPVFVILDVGQGDSNFQSAKPGVQGGSVLGASLLVNVHGKMNCQAQDVAQGSTIGGVGILVDFGQGGEFKALRRAQGHALCGVGILLNKGGGDNKYRAALWAQGFGAPGGFGILEDIAGNDHYYCGGLYIDSYPEHPGYDGWGQGVGAGIRQVANGGIGLIFDGSGDDIYEVDYFGHGVGYWLGVGIARDFGGNDRRLGSTQLAYNGQPRRESKWTRFVNGIGCHYSLGFLYDDDGHDYYGGTIMGTGMAWDLSIGVLCDFNGSDTYAATGGMTQGVGAEGSIGVLFDYGGDDKYMGRNQAYASGGISYHSISSCGSNFSFLVDYGGNDSYGCGARNDSYVQRGSSGGFLIDRPLESEAEAKRLAEAKAAEERAEREAVEAKAREEAIEVIKGLLAEKKPLTQQQRQLWYQHQRLQQRQQQMQGQPQRNQGRPASQQQIGSVPSLGKAPKRIGNSGNGNVK